VSIVVAALYLAVYCVFRTHFVKDQKGRSRAQRSVTVVMLLLLLL